MTLHQKTVELMAELLQWREDGEVEGLRERALERLDCDPGFWTQVDALARMVVRLLEEGKRWED